MVRVQYYYAGCSKDTNMPIIEFLGHTPVKNYIFQSDTHVNLIYPSHHNQINKKLNNFYRGNELSHILLTAKAHEQK